MANPVGFSKQSDMQSDVLLLSFFSFLHKNAENNYIDQRLGCVANAGRDIQHWLVDDISGQAEK